MRVTASLAMGVLSMVMAQTANAAEDLVQVRAELMGLSYQLRDLTPDDEVGTAFSNYFRGAENIASATYGVQGLTASGNKIVDTVTDSTTVLDLRESLFSPLAMNASLLTGEATANRTAAGAKANVVLDNSRFAEGFTYGQLGVAPYGGPFVQASLQSGTTVWTLGKGTELSFTATITVGVSVNAGSLVGLTQAETLRVLGVADVWMGFTPQSWQSTQNLEFAEGAIQQSLSIAQDVGPGGVISTGIETSQQRTFTLTGLIRNNGSSEVFLNGSWYVDALARVSPVPEPSTWVLIAAGLGIVPLARRRQAA